MNSRYIFTYLQNPQDAKDIVLDTGLTAIIEDPEKIGLSIQQLKTLDGEMNEFLTKRFRNRPVKLYCGTTPIAFGEVIGGQMQGNKLLLHYEIIEVYNNNAT